MNAQRVGDYHFFVPEVEYPGTPETVLQALPEGCPLIHYLQGAPCTEVKEIVIEIIPRRLSDLRIEPAVLTVENETAQGIVIQLPDDIVRVLALWEALVVKKMDYNIQTFWEDYARDCQSFLAHLTEDWVQATRLNGIQAQVDTDVRLDLDEVGFAPETAQKVLEMLQELHPTEVLNFETLEGIEMLNQRFPVASPKGGRMTIIRILPDRQERVMYVNPEAWNDWQGGDTDGDGGYCAVVW